MTKTIIYLLSFFAILPLSTWACEKLVWSDEFDYEGRPDLTKWGYDIGGNGWGNYELQYYTNKLENAFVENGFLTIRALKESYNGSAYTSARLVSKNKGDWKYGKFEVRAKLPKGRGTWPAIWMLPTDWKYGGWPESGEIDIMEHVGYDENIIHGTVHTEAYNHSKGTQKGNSKVVSNATSAFHIYGIEWRENRIDFFIDGTQYFTFYKESNNYQQWPFDEYFHLILNIAIGGNWGGAKGVDNEIFPTEMVVDYVRVYEILDNLTIEGKQGINKSETELIYNTSEIEGANYIWTVPDDADIVSGQGTNEIVVSWGTEEGDVSVKVESNNDCNGKTASLSVRFSYSSNGLELLIDDFENTSLGKFKEDDSYASSQSEGRFVMKKLSERCNLNYQLDIPVNISKHTLLKVPVNYFNTNNTQVVIALFDESGKKIKVGPFELNNGTWQIDKYIAFDFKEQTDGEFEFELLKEIDFQFTKGIVNAAFDKISFFRTDSLPKAPNNLRVFDFGNQLLWWEDSDNAATYELKFATEENGTYITLSSNISGLELPYQVSFSESKKYYRVFAKNESGLSEMSNPVTIESTGFINTEKKAQINYYGGLLSVSADFKIEKIGVYSISGKSIFIDNNLETANFIKDIEFQKSGIYLIHIEGKGMCLNQKFLVN